MKPWHELGITDDFIFCKVMQNESICRQMLELLLNTRRLLMMTKPTKYFYNLSASELQREDSKLGTFLRYLETNKPNDGFTNLISKEVEKCMEAEVEKEVEKCMEAEVEKELKNRKETIRNIVKEMIKNNIDLNTISSITKLSKDEILTIQSS